MLLETAQTILERLKGLKDLALEVLAFPAATSSTAPTEDQQVDNEISEPDNAVQQKGEIISGEENSGPSAEEILPIVDDGAGVFRFAHDFVIHNPTIISQIINSGAIGLKILGEKRMIGAEVDSSARKYSPKCHPETRKSIKKRIIEWMAAMRDYDLTEQRREKVPRMLWIMGPAGVGKSAVAQTIAEETKEEGRLAAALFFSRPSRRDDPEQVIPTLAYQLAVKHPKYKLILNQRLANDPTLLEKTYRTQFKELIIDPFSVIMTRDPSICRRPLLIVLDGLDECKSEEAQCEFIELIAEHVRSVHEFPLLWLVCSRPEWHFRYLLFRPDFPATCRREQMTIDDPEARKDVAIFLREEFSLIRQRFSDYLPSNWPPSDGLQVIIVKASGLFALATTVTRFIGDITANNPQRQLRICLDCFNGLSGHGGPFETLDVLYREICSTIPSANLPVTKRILGLCVFYSDSTSLSAQQLANFLGLEQPEFDLSLRRLHSVLKIPSGVEAQHTGIQFYHASFQDFLRRPERSRQYVLHEEAVHHDVAMHALVWHMHSELSRPELTWASGTSVEDLHFSLSNFSSSVAWRACSKVTGRDTQSLVEMLTHFNFTKLEGDMDGFPQFLSWLHSLVPSTSLLIHLRAHTCPAHHFAKRIALLHDPESIRLHFPSSVTATLYSHVGSGTRCCEFELRMIPGTDPSADFVDDSAEREDVAPIIQSFTAASGDYSPTPTSFSEEMITIPGQVVPIPMPEPQHYPPVFIPGQVYPGTAVHPPIIPRDVTPSPPFSPVIPPVISGTHTGAAPPGAPASQRPGPWGQQAPVIPIDLAHVIPHPPPSHRATPVRRSSTPDQPFIPPDALESDDEPRIIPPPTGSRINLIIPGRTPSPSSSGTESTRESYSPRLDFTMSSVSMEARDGAASPVMGSPTASIPSQVPINIPPEQDPILAVREWTEANANFPGQKGGLVRELPGDPPPILQQEYHRPEPRSTHSRRPRPSNSGTQETSDSD